MPNPFAHVELNTGDLKKAKKFYQAVFSWSMRDMPGMNYTMIDVGAGVGGGMQKKPMKEAPTTWLPYVQVDDVKKTLATAKKAGAKIALDFMSIGDMGAIGVFIDPTGASLGVWEMGKPSKPAKKVSAKKPAKKPAKKK
jgi:predicted enzyme related to lactoylglutathione lyase